MKMIQFGAYLAGRFVFNLFWILAMSLWIIGAAIVVYILILLVLLSAAWESIEFDWQVFKRERRSIGKDAKMIGRDLWSKLKAAWQKDFAK